MTTDKTAPHRPNGANPERTLNSPWAEGSGTPVTIPAAPTGVAVVTAHQSLQVTWNAPADRDGGDGGSDITGYKVMWNAGVSRLRRRFLLSHGCTRSPV